MSRYEAQLNAHEHAARRAKQRLSVDLSLGQLQLVAFWIKNQLADKARFVMRDDRRDREWWVVNLKDITGQSAWNAFIYDPTLNAVVTVIPGEDLVRKLENRSRKRSGLR